MKTLLTAAVLAIAAGSTLAATNTEEPLWAYGFNGPPSGASSVPPPAARPDNTTLLHVAGSKQSFTRAQVIDYYGPADWFPEDHPPMPDIVARGRKAAVPPIIACAYATFRTATGGRRTPTSPG